MCEDGIPHMHIPNPNPNLKMKKKNCKNCSSSPNDIRIN